MKKFILTLLSLFAVVIMLHAQGLLNQDLRQIHVDQLSDEQYSAAVDRWLESHPEASSAESKTAMGQLLQEVYSQYPRSALGPALDMALQRGQRNALTPAAPPAPS